MSWRISCSRFESDGSRRWASSPQEKASSQACTSEKSSIAFSHTFFCGLAFITPRRMLSILGASHWPTSTWAALPAASRKRSAADALFRSRIHVYSATTILSIAEGPSISLMSLPVAAPPLPTWCLHATWYMPSCASTFAGSSFRPLA